MGCPTECISTLALFLRFREKVLFTTNTTQGLAQLVIRLSSSHLN